ncbi:XrtA system polysaccharide chain length determinant [Rhodospirillaceae bacterium SYSU D60014]|uniref:XrtA system polysaccharide chain length determinant n=1 Tax=Virgifigura deserti TaxID=2268457 RepID=UPI000E672C88
MLPDTINPKVLIQYYLSELWARRWLVVGVAWLVSIIGWTIVAMMPDRYTATARIYVDTQSLLNPLMKGLAVSPNISEQIEIMRRTLLTRPNLEELLRMTDQDLGIDSPEAAEAKIRALQIQLQLIPQRDQLFEVIYENNDPELAQRVVQSLLTIFVEQNLGTSRQDMARARRFIDAQIAEYEGRLREAEASVAEFKRDNASELNYQERYSGRLQQGEFEIQRLETALQSAIWQRDELRAELARTPETVASTATATSPAQQRLEELQQQMTDLRLRYTAEHPTVINLQRMIDSTEQQVANERSGALQLPNPAYLQLEGEIDRMEREIRLTERRLETQRAEVQMLRQRIQEVPPVALQLAQMTRDYDVLRQNYDRLIERRESARLAQNLDDQTTNVEFRIVEPPVVPLRPSGPNRPLFFTGVLFAGLAAGVGIALVQIQLKDSFSTIAQLRDAFSVPVLGSLSLVQSTVRDRLYLVDVSALALSLVALVGVFGALVLLFPDLVGLSNSVYGQLQTLWS